MNEFTPEELTISISALAKLNLEPGNVAFTDAWVEAAANKLNEFKAADLAMSISALAKLNLEPGNTAFTDAWVEVTTNRLNEFKAEDLAICASALAELNIDSGHVARIDTWTKAAANRLGHFNAEELEIIKFALTGFEHRDKEFENKLGEKTDLYDKIKHLLNFKQQAEEIGLEASCSTQHRTKRDASHCNKDDDYFSDAPLEEEAFVEQVRAARIYTQVAIAVALRNADHNTFDSILKYNKNIGDIISEETLNHSPREQQIIAAHYLQAKHFLEIYPENTLWKPYQVLPNHQDQTLLFDNGKKCILAFIQDNRYVIYSQDLNYKQQGHTREGLTFEELEGFIKAFFKLHSVDGKYQVFTLSDNIHDKLTDYIKNSGFLHPKKVVPDIVLLLEEHAGLIESIPASVVVELFKLNGQTPDIRALHVDFFKRGNISLRIEALHKILPSLSSDQIKSLVLVIKNYHINYDRTSLGNLLPDEKRLLELYYNKVIDKIKAEHILSNDDLSSLSWSSLYEDLAQHHDISEDLAKDIVASTQKIHGVVSKGAILKGIATQSLFFLPDMMRAYNSGEFQSVAQTAEILAGDAVINKAYSTFKAEIVPLLPPSQRKLLEKLPFASPIFKALTIHSIVDLHQTLQQLPPDSEQSREIKHNLGEQYATLGLIVAEIFGFEAEPLWAALAIEQLIYDATSFRERNHLDVPFWEAFLMSLGFEAEKLQNIFEERELAEMSLTLVNQINAQAQIPFGLTVVKIPKLGESRWQDINENEVTEDIKTRTATEIVNAVNKTIMEIQNGAIYNFTSVIGRFKKIVSLKFFVLNDKNDKREAQLLLNVFWQHKVRDAVSNNEASVSFAVDVALPSYENQHSAPGDKKNFFLDQGSNHNANWHKVPTQYVKNIGLAEVYYNDQVNNNNLYVYFDPREGNLDLELTQEGLQALDQMNRSLINGTNAAGKFIQPYIVTIQIGYKKYPKSIYFLANRSKLLVNDAGDTLIAQYMISDDTACYIENFASITKLYFTAGSKQDSRCSMIGSSTPSTIYIAKRECDSKIVHDQHDDIDIMISMAGDQRYLQLVFNGQKIDSHLRLSAEHVEIVAAQGLSWNSKIDLMTSVLSFNISMRGDITVCDHSTCLQLEGVCDLPKAVYSNNASNKVMSLYEIALEDLGQTVGTFLRLSIKSSDSLDITFMSPEFKFHWIDKLSQSNTLRISGKLDGKAALLQIEDGIDTLKIFDAKNQAVHTEIIHYDGRATITHDLVLIKVFKGNTALADHYSLVANISDVYHFESPLKISNSIYHDHVDAGVLVFRDFANHLFYHCFTHSNQIRINDINYLVSDQKICAVAEKGDVLNGQQLIRYSSLTSDLDYQMIGVCFKQSALESVFGIQNNSLVINDIILENINNDTKLYFDDTEILRVEEIMGFL